MKFRVRFGLLKCGLHVKSRVFIAPKDNADGQLMGTLFCSRGKEFREFMIAFNGADFLSDQPEFGIVDATADVPEGGDHTHGP